MSDDKNHFGWMLFAIILGVVACLMTADFVNNYWETKCVKKGIAHYESNEGGHPVFVFNVDSERKTR